MVRLLVTRDACNAYNVVSIRMMLDTLIVNYNTAQLLRPMFDACTSSATGLDVRYWVVDNASSDDSVAVLQHDFAFAGLKFNSQNLGFGRANNQLLPLVRSDADYVLLLNTDAFVAPDTLQKTLAYMQTHADVGVLGVRLVGRDGDLQPSCRYFPTPVNVFLSRTGLARLFPWVRLVDDMDWPHDQVRVCDWVPGCYYLVRKQVLDQLGLFDRRFFLYYEEVDHCKRVKAAGWKVVFYPHTTVVHIGGESAKSVGALSVSGRQLSALQIESEMLYFKKHHGLHGLWLHLLLVHLGDVLLVVKDVLKGRGLTAARAHIAYGKLVRQLCSQTLWATQPTR